MIPVEYNGRYYGKMKGIGYLSSGDEVLISTKSGKNFTAEVESIPDTDSISGMSMADRMLLRTGGEIIYARKRTISGTKLSIVIDGIVEDIRILKEIKVKPLTN